MARPTAEEIDEAVETLGALVAAHPRRLSGVPSMTTVAALDVLKDAVALPDLVGHSQASKILGVDTANLRRLAELPEPLYDLPAGKFYERDAIESLASQRAAARAARRQEVEANG